MNKALVFSAAAAAMLAISGCGDSPKSIEDYQKLPKAELESMYDKCEKKLLNKDFSSRDEMNEAIKKEEAINKVTKKINEARGTSVIPFGLAWYGTVTDEELSKFGNSEYAEYVECGRIGIALQGGLEEFNKPRPSLSERFKNIGK
ncbi:hypothetical protein BKN38_05270 [Helicobacter sp. CLO-3]|uniref:hypothetical protein n=1 Tax=unclassified Helicobacter TaxID=2593540 RepID=UPI000805C662|nr:MULTISPECIES: hypothetical protein [unclassified Helicobacter]OBV30138.1 hypothetical protein BA723_02535 [Helicobacter sp. CLO-3]OHU83518.1 hypothetical protein BKN38_05270 [Helicobacter sp. CLO-3]